MTAAKAHAPQGAQVGISSPFPQDRSSIESIVWNDLLDDARELLPMTRAEAMTIPAIAKGRHVVAPKIAGTPLRRFRYTPNPDNADALGTDEELAAPSWVTRTDSDLPPWHRMTWTVDDLIFTGWSLWRAVRGYGGVLLAADRIGVDRWRFSDPPPGQAGWTILVDEEPVSADEVILIPGPHEGICTFGATTIRHAADLLTNAKNAGRTPSAHMELHNEGPDMTDDAIDALIDRWAKARRGENSGVGYTSKNLTIKEHGSIDAQLLVDGRNAAAVECARIIGVAAGMVDATAPKASLNYETTQGRGLEHTEYGVEPYSEAIAARLSMDDVVPRGQRMRFDITQDTGPVLPTGPTEED